MVVEGAACAACDGTRADHASATTAAHRRRHDRRRRLRGRGRRPRPAGRRARRRCSTPARRAPASATSPSPTPTASAGSLVGLGKRERVRPRARPDRRRRACSAAPASSARSALCWELPAQRRPTTHAARVRRGHAAGARYEFTALQDRAPTRTTPAASSTSWSSPPTTTSPTPSRAAASSREAVNPARDLQNTPGQRPHADARWPSARAQVAERHDALTLEVDGPRARSRRPGWAPSPASPRAADEEPQLITLRYDAAGATGPVLGFVGKAVTFDSGGISIKPGNKMSDMKFDMSGGAAVLGRDRGDRAARAAGAGRRGDRRDREPAVRARDEARRHRARAQRHDDRGHQHRRRGPARARRLPRARASSRAPSGSSTSRR